MTKNLDLDDIEKKQLVKAIIGNIIDYNFDIDDIEPITDEEVREIEEEYQKNLSDGLIKPVTEEQNSQLRKTIEECRQWFLYSLWMKSKGESYYDLYEWLNITDKPYAPIGYEETLS